MDSQLTLLATLTALTLAFGYLLRARSTSSAPPGPPAHPLLGHALIFPKQLSWERFHAWSKKYNSDIIQLSMLGTNVVILDTLQATKELLDKRSSSYSSRPRMPMVTELMGWDFNLGTMPYGSRWRAHRKLFERSFHANAGALYEPKSLKASRELVESLWHEPERFLDHFRHMAGSVILSVTYGIQTQRDNDPFVKLSEAGIKPVLEAVVPGTYLVDTFPILKYIPDWMPFARFKKVAKEARKASMAMVELPFEHAKRTMVEQNVAPSFVSTRLQNMENAANPEEDEERIKSTAATMYSAGFDNIISTLTGFVLGILENPEAQTKAQKEIDSILLSGELPTFDDKESLPYVTALTMEVFRWAISSPIGAPHMLISDDVYNGYRLKSGSLVFANIWYISSSLP
ncbi:hypothetical protein D9613_007521 [Agrocybe pediades]|uniref:Cytochrome P450 n=1 Tax=Agrocybe pediades TaxID=84607 RepID=A0A8H4QM43_9AGAR|nr:hypothetical protein D9613_007521 [Agrocybe pediades]